MKPSITASGLALALIACGPSAPEPTAPTPSESSPETGSEQTDADAGSDESEPPDTESAPANSSRPREKEPTSDSPLAEIMAGHARDAEKIRAAVIEGRPEDSGPAAESILHLFDVEKLPREWIEPAARMQASARRIKDSSDIAGVAAAIADVGTSCGWCHSKLGGPEASAEPAPPNDGTLESRMKQHSWATEKLWEGLYVPSSTAWADGARILSGTEFPSEVLQRGVYAKSSAQEFKKLAAKLPSQSTPTTRAALYARLLGTCGSCHLAQRE